MSEEAPGPRRSSADESPPPHGRWRLPRLDLASQVLLGLGLGVAAGVFLGELAGSLQIVGDIFIRLLQMTVLPFVMLSLVAGLGRLEYAQAVIIAKRGGGALLVLIGIALLVVFLLPLSWPRIESASFFSNSLVAETPPVDLLSLYIPSNPFFSLVNALVPAIVVFSIALGVALIGVQGKARLLEVLDTLVEALMKITGVVAKLAPYGVFAITASAVGTLSLSELERIQVYIVSYASAALLLGFWILPGFVATLTPISRAAIIRRTWSALITAFGTANLLIVIPMLTEAGRGIVREALPEDPEAPSAVEVMIPTSFNFPSTGKLLSMLFLPFAAWFGGGGLGASQWLTLAFAGTTSFFGQTVIAVPFMLDLLRLPSDLFRLFLAVDVFASRFGVMLAAVFTISISLLGAVGVPGGLRARLPALLRFGAVSLGALLGLVAGLRLLFTFIHIDYTGYDRFIALDLRNPPVAHRVLKEEQPPPSVRPEPGRRLQQVLARQELRVCYFKDAMPFAFQNEAGHLVGYDIDMMHGLARDLGVSLLFYRLGDGGEVRDRLADGSCDIVVSGVALSTRRAAQYTLSQPYLQIAIAFVMPDYRRAEFATWAGLREHKGLRLGIRNLPYYIRRLKRRLPDAELVPIETPRAYFTGKLPDLDALVMGAETGSAWSLVYPAFNVVVPKPGKMLAPIAYALPEGEPGLTAVVNTWIQLTRDDGTADALFAHWILGEGAKSKEKRWSVIRDVLGWVD